MVQMKYLVALAPFALLAHAGDPKSTHDDHSVDNSHADQTINQGAYIGGCGRAFKRDTFGDVNGGGSVQGVNMKCTRAEHVEAEMEARDIEAGFDALEALSARGDPNSTYDDHSVDNSQSNGNGISGADLAALIKSMQRRGDPNSTYDDHSVDNSQSNNNGISGADLAALIKSMQRRGDPNSTHDDHSVDNSQSNGNGISGADLAALIKSMQRRGDPNSTHDDHSVDNSQSNGNGISAADLAALIKSMQRRGDPNSTYDDHSQDNSSASTNVNGGAYIGGCRRSDFGLAERSNNHYGNVNGGGSIQGVNLTCRRSTQLAIRDVGATYRRLQTRSMATEEEAGEAADMLRRHAEHLGML